MNILVTGASGMVGSALVPILAARGHRVVRMVRGRPAQGAQEIYWNPDAGDIDAPSLLGFDAVVHLAGENIGAGRWTGARKRRILDSRVKGTRLLAATLSGLERPPKVMISSSAVGYYGDRGAEILREDSSPGSGFLADVCRQWEEAASKAGEGNIRLVLVRTGMVISAGGGALARMLPAFRLGFGGRLGSGKQYISWITLEDLLEVFLFALSQPALSGAVNAVAPTPVTNTEFTRTLGRLLSRPTLIPVPSLVIRLMFGEMGEQVLLASTRVDPARLTQARFQFRFPELEGALRQCLGTTGSKESD